MSIVETGAKAMRSVVWTEDDWDTIGDAARDLYRNEFRAALRSVKPEDVSDRMVDVFNSEMLQHTGDLRSGDERKKAAIAAAIAAGAE